GDGRRQRRLRRQPRHRGGGPRLLEGLSRVYGDLDEVVRPINVRVEALCGLDVGHHDASETQASLARLYQFLNVVVINRNLDDDRLLRGAYLDKNAPSGVERRRIEKEKFINSKMRAQIQPLHPLLVGAEGDDEKSVGI